MNKEWSDKNKLAQSKLKKTSFQEGINEYIELREILMQDEKLIAPRNYESVGTSLYDRKKNKTENAYTGDYLYYEIVL